MTNTETVGTSRPDGQYWVRFGTGHDWEVMRWDGSHFWGTAGDGYRGEDFEIGPQVFPPGSRHPEPLAEQKRYLKDGPVLRLVRLRFFRDLIQSERVKVYEVFGIDKDDLPNPLTLGIEQQVFNQLFVRAASIPAPERSKEETGKALPDDDNALAQMVEDFHVGSVAFADDPDEFCHLIEFTPELLRAFVAALETPPLHKEEEAEYVTVDHKGCIFHSKDMDGIARIAKANLEAAVAAAAPVPVPVTITPEMIERAAIGIYEEAPSIGLDCECGWRDQTPQYKQKARMIARAALTAALSVKPGEQG